MIKEQELVFGWPFWQKKKIILDIYKLNYKNEMKATIPDIFILKI